MLHASTIAVISSQGNILDFMQPGLQNYNNHYMIYMYSYKYNLIIKQKNPEKQEINIYSDGFT